MGDGLQRMRWRFLGDVWAFVGFYMGMRFLGLGFGHLLGHLLINMGVHHGLFFVIGY